MIDYKETAKAFNIADKIEKLEKELLQIPDVINVEWDLTGFYSGIYQVIFLLKYNITAEREDYWEARKNLITNAIKVINDNELYKTEDRIEDYGQHFYFVAGCKASWRNQ